jgi:ubiquinone/menaquinone biosynthesis C-methylase UbiE
MKILDLGCGINKTKGAIGVDKIKLPSVDVTHNLDKFPYPFKTNEFDKIFCNHILEHLNDIADVMEELHRISKPNAVIEIRVPYYASHYAFADPTHKHYFSWKSFDYFTKNQRYDWCTRGKFKIIEKRFNAIGRIKKFAFWLILENKFPVFYERFLNRILIADEMLIRMKVIKSENLGGSK